MKLAFKQRWLVGIMVVLAFAMFVGGCGSSKIEAFNQYSQVVQPVLKDVQTEGEKWDALRSKSGSGQISDYQLALSIKNELLPGMLKLQERMEKVQPPQELVSTHETGIKMINKSVQAYSEVISAVQTRDTSKITSANGCLSEARELERKYVREIQEYRKKL